ncbi:MAG: hypothetical protein GWM90_22235, partial [Gemmatimonadetes bacterium]|nr:hypothetical protein [Gemmatimonadota bacterium]NIQ57326.1 hypothetical protein [Gemmatimonadota bacterium]NIU77484.1 hypothetical protein [Gammaproteobacteria bacterium]NIX46703.1 hypothetical protein [Gemmatimonadota bacterium]NIY11052.1 hypothetical protein [Gemmatimonadota bacterium]
ALKIVGDWLGLESLAATIVEPLNNQDWGLGITLVGGLNEDINRLERTLRTMANPEFRARSVELAADWWVATPAWILLLAAVVAFMATL